MSFLLSVQVLHANDQLRLQMRKGKVFQVSPMYALFLALLACVDLHLKRTCQTFFDIPLCVWELCPAEFENEGVVCRV